MAKHKIALVALGAMLKGVRTCRANQTSLGRSALWTVRSKASRRCLNIVGKCGEVAWRRLQYWNTGERFWNWARAVAEILLGLLGLLA